MLSVSDASVNLIIANILLQRDKHGSAGSRQRTLISIKRKRPCNHSQATEAVKKGLNWGKARQGQSMGYGQVASRQNIDSKETANAWEEI
jgi:hypothetical protein